MAAGTERKRFLAAFLSCWEIHKDKEPTKIILSAYQEALKKFSIEQIEKAFGQAIANLRWFPKPIDLIEMITGGSRQQIEDKGTSEAFKVIRAVKRIGGYCSVKFDNRITMAVIESCFGGWIKLCDDMTEENEKWFVRDFGKYYQIFSRSQREITGHLPGRIEIDNSVKGFHDSIVEPVFIGDSDITEIEHSEITKGFIKSV